MRSPQFRQDYAVAGIEADSVAGRIAMIMSGGTEGGLSPHFLVFAVAPGGENRTGGKV
jgi:cyanuric acid amidohydrolase